MSTNVCSHFGALLVLFFFISLSTTYNFILLYFVLKSPFVKQKNLLLLQGDMSLVADAALMFF